MFTEELEYFKQNQDGLVTKYKGKILVIKGSSIFGAYQTVIEALREASAKFDKGSFMLQPCEPGPEAYTVTISSDYVCVK